MENINHAKGVADGTCEKCKQAFSTTLELELHDKETHGAQIYAPMFEVVSAMETTLHITDDELENATPSDEKLFDEPANSDLEVAKETEVHGTEAVDIVDPASTHDSIDNKLEMSRSLESTSTLSTMSSENSDVIAEDSPPVLTSAEPWQPQKYQFDGKSVDYQPRCVRQYSGDQYSMMLYHHALSSSQDTEEEDDDMEFDSIY